MPRFHFSILLRSFRYALKGLRFTYRQEQNFRVQLIVAAAVVVLMVSLPVTVQQAIILVMVIFGVLILELLNTAFERFVDLLKPRLHYLVEVIKDVMAAAVFLASLGAVIIGMLIFLPYLWR